MSKLQLSAYMPPPLADEEVANVVVVSSAFDIGSAESPFRASPPPDEVASGLPHPPLTIVLLVRRTCQRPSGSLFAGDEQ